MSQVLYVLACGAPPARDVEVLAGLAQDRGWDVCVITSPMGSRFVDAARLEKITGHPVRSDDKAADDPDTLPRRTRWPSPLRVPKTSSVLVMAT